jgi:3-oxoacyl-[acyl-carrier protein] reductase
VLRAALDRGTSELFPRTISERNQQMATTSAQPPRLKNKHAVIFGASGAVGAAVAKAFAAHGATVFLSGPRQNAVSQLANEITTDGGIAYPAVVDALDEQMVTAYLDRVAKEAGSIDILLNAMGPQPKDYANGTSTLSLSLEQFLLPLTTMVPSQFITARAAARHMVQQKSGVVLFVTSTPALGLAPNVTAIGTAFGAIEALLRGLATDLGPAGVRVVGIRTGGMVDTRTMQQTFENVAQTLGVSNEEVVHLFAQRTLLRSIPTVADTARVAVFLASDEARTLTGAILNASSGATNDH